MSQLIAALTAPSSATPSAQYGTPVMHSTSSSFRKDVDPRNRPDPRAASRRAEREALNAARRERNKALNEEQARKNAEARARAKASKVSGSIMRMIGGTTGGTLGTKPAPAPVATPSPAPAPSTAPVPATRVVDSSVGSTSRTAPMTKAQLDRRDLLERLAAEEEERNLSAANYRKYVDDAIALSRAKAEDTERYLKREKGFDAGREWAQKYGLGDVDLFREGIAERSGEFGPTKYPRGSISEEVGFTRGVDNARYRAWKNKKIDDWAIPSDLYNEL